jgi:NAD(P)-dependent dehydrogenase (short-subunit alcohol dehydrogenase family)
MVAADGSTTVVGEAPGARPADHQTLRGQRVVVVGGTSGMGLGGVRAALALGAEVVVAGRRPVAERRPVLGADGNGNGDGDADEGSRVSHAVVDVEDESSVRALFDATGPLDHLFVTAAPAPGSWGTFIDQDVAGARRYLDGKFFGSWACARYAAPLLRPGGSITFLTGVAAVRPRPGSAMVTATFAALEAFARALALDVAPVRVNTIRPGFTDSDMWAFMGDDERDALRRQVREALPAGRIGTVEDIGQAAAFLMTNPYVTGAVLEVSGGESLVNTF